MVFNVTFNNISVISWWSVLLIQATRVIFTGKIQVSDTLHLQSNICNVYKGLSIERECGNVPFMRSFPLYTG